MYKVKEIYYTIQGEGYHTGRPAVFVRFSGCNLWSGREEDRDKAICKFCDTDFWGTDGERGGKYTAEQLSAIVYDLWPTDMVQHPFIVCTGGEPGLQLDQALVDFLHGANIQIAIETNGTVELANDIDWICVSPKADSKIIITYGNELKLVYPQLENDPEQYSHLDFEHYYLQPLDDESQAEHISKCVEYCMRYPQWKLSLQTHKFIGID